MLNRTCLFTMIATLLILGAPQARAATRHPTAVQAEIHDMDKTCREMGKPVPSPDLVTIVDLTGDGLPDYIFDQRAYVCDGALTLFMGGSGNAEVDIYVGTRDG